MYVQVDASQLEWRVAVELSQDVIAIKEILEKQDVHSNNQKAFSLPTRLISKTYLFRTIFRGNGWSFANDSNFMHVSNSSEYWDGINEKFYAKYSGLNKQHYLWKNLVLEGQPIVSPLGREWKIVYDGIKIPWTILSNYPVQGTGADIMMLARVIFRNRLKKMSYSHLIFLITSVHDSIIVDCPNELIPEIVKLFYEVFADLQKNIKQIWGYTWVVPLECECKIGQTMKGMKKYPCPA